MTLAAVILDGLGPRTLRELNLQNVQKLYREESSEVLGCSSLPHTALSNPVIWSSGRSEKVWLEGKQDWTDPAAEFERGEADEDSLHTRKDFHMAFTWEVLQQQGVESSALQIPFILPPLDFNTLDGYDPGDSWFPDSKERIKEHEEFMFSEIREHAKKRDFVAASVQVPDKYYHHGDERFTKEQAPEMDERVGRMIEFFRSEGIDWMIFGDHGRPRSGASVHFETKSLLPRHEKEALVISSLENPPRYTDRIHRRILSHFEAEDLAKLEVETQARQTTSKEEAVKKRLRNLGYNHR